MRAAGLLAGAMLYAQSVGVNAFSGNTACEIDMKNIEHLAQSQSEGRRPDGRCYSHVSSYIDKVGYGGISKGGFDRAIPSAYWAEVRYFGPCTVQYCIEDMQAIAYYLFLEQTSKPGQCTSTRQAHQFADYLNKDGNAARLGLKNIQAHADNNPYKAPEGSIVVVRAGTPGTANPTAGDIAVKGPGDDFYNGEPALFLASSPPHSCILTCRCNINGPW